MGDVLVFAEHQGGHLPKTTLTAIHAGAELAQKRGVKCLVVVASDSPDALAAELAKYGAAKVIALAHPALKNYLADAHAAALTALVKKIGAEYVLATATAIGKDLMPRLAARLGAPMASEIVGINDDGTLVRPMYAGNVLATIELDGPVKVVTVRGTAFDAAKPTGAAAAVEKQDAEIDSAACKTEFVSFNATKSDRPQLTEARIVVSGGRGLKSGDNFKIVLEPLVDEMGAAMGASRAAVDAGFVPNDLQVGQTGKVVAPELYVAVGISGAIQHLAGMKDSKIIVAINKDEEAAIFSVADYGLVADLFKAVPEMVDELKKVKQH
ncbi:MAG TPA: electron transfer flavoprotein subunit alpha/FixB family protein [Candidatus Binataceae bacterium]|nr:electron transfer flavoprotein subunit alpha/FixB family protein [Candidatus Binataceae bacterium]